MTDQLRWLRNSQLIGQLDQGCRQRFEDLLKELESRGWKPLVKETRRSKARQVLLVARRVSWTLNSKHLTGQAADIIDDRWEWGKTPREFMVDLAIISWRYGLGTGLGWGFPQKVKEQIKGYLEGGQAGYLNALISHIGWGKDPCHVEVGGVE